MDFKELRTELIILNNTLKELEPETDLLAEAKRSLIVGRMWAGKYLGVGKFSSNPYNTMDGKRKTKADISPTFDYTLKTLDKEIMKKDLVEVIDTCREHLKTRIEDLVIYQIEYNGHMKNLLDNSTPMERIKIYETLHNIYTNLVEARMWLGNSLAILREEK